MAQEDALSKAKATLASANKLSSQADPTGAMSKPAPMPNVAPKVVAPVAGGDNGGPADNRAAINAEGAKVGMKGVPIMHDGGMVKKTGPAILEKGEKVVPKEKAMKNPDLGKMAGAKKDVPAKHESKGKTKHKHTHIEHHDDGSHTVRHTPKGGGDEVSYSKPDLDGVMDGLHQNLGGGQVASAAASPDMGAPAGASPAAAAPAPAPAAPPMGI